jgi:hypothetical protein
MDVFLIGYRSEVCFKGVIYSITLIVTVASVLVDLPSEATYLKLSVPVAFGV